MTSTESPYSGASQLMLSATEQNILMAPVEDEIVEIRPDGLIYVPHPEIRQRLNRATGPGQWALIPVGEPRINGDTVLYKGRLYLRGHFIGEAVGECRFVSSNPDMTWASALEGARSDALTRCSKDLGMFSELWTPSFIARWKAEYTVAVWRKGWSKPQWRRKDREPWYDETGVAGVKEKALRFGPVIKADASPSADYPHDLPDEEPDPEGRLNG